MKQLSSSDGTMKSLIELLLIIFELTTNDYNDNYPSVKFTSSIFDLIDCTKIS